MKKNVIAVMVGLVTVLSFGACKKKAEEPVQAPHGPLGPSMMMPKGETQVIVPDNIQGKWGAVILAVEDKEKNKVSEVTVKIGGEYTIPETKIKIKVGDFLPDFKMDGLTITSASEDPNNPAVHVNVYDGDVELFKGWLYSKFPSIHPFQHERYGLGLKEAVKS